MIKKIYQKILNINHQWQAKRNPLNIEGSLELTDEEMPLIESKLIPRGDLIDIVYSKYHSIEFKLIPKSVLGVISRNWSKIERALGAEGVIRSCYVYRNINIPQDKRKKEFISDAWHRDTIGITNVQMFILLHDTDIKNGPFRYIKSQDIKKVENKYPDLKNHRNRSIKLNIDEKYVSYFVGSRGDFLLVSTFSNYHSATIPEFGFKRDMISIAFEPKSLTSFKNTLCREDVENLIN
ncbi:hypothetical protein N9N15_01590 [Flavobacteriaceae bacterium]|nr:hypothetical protein [Flavobacteriaceae bacterium]